MKAFYIVIFCFVGSLLISNCNDKDDNIVNEDEDIEVNTNLDPEMELDSILSLSSFKEIPHTPGIYNDNIQLNDGEFWNYKLSVPTLEIGEEAPLIIGLVWDGPMNEHYLFFDCLLEPAFSRTESYLFVPADVFVPWSHPKAEQRILEFVNYAIQYWSVKEDQIVVAGYSKGGLGAWHYSINHDSIFAAGIPMASGHNLNKIPKIPIYGICGNNDELVNCSAMESLVNKSLSEKSVFKLEQNLSHYEACNYQQCLSQAANWLENIVFRN